MATLVSPPRPDEPPAPTGPAGTLRPVLVRFTATVIAGVFTGLVAGGIGGRLAMLVLRLTTGDSVHGVVSDDGFIIGQVTLAGTIGLFAVGMGFGIIGAMAHRLVVPWLIGPRWFRRLTTATGSGVVVGALLVHRDGIDFTSLRPAWLAIALFVLVPGIYGALIGPVQEFCDRPDSWLNRNGRRRVAVTVLTLASVFFLLLFVAVFFAFTWAWAALRRAPSPAETTATHPVAAVAARAPWVAIVAAGLFDLVRDAAALI